MTQSPDHPGEQETSPGATPPPQGAQQPYPSAPPISEPYGSSGPSDVPGELAGRWQRLFAAIIDGVIINVVAWAISAPLVGNVMFSTKHLGDRFVASGIGAVIAILYFGLQHGKWGQSIGKRALGIRVVSAPDGGPITYGAAFVRVAFTYVLSLITFGIGALIDGIWILWDGRKQTLHDKVAKTYVVNATGTDPYAGR